MPLQVCTSVTESTAADTHSTCHKLLQRRLTWVLDLPLDDSTPLSKFCHSNLCSLLLPIHISFKSLALNPSLINRLSLRLVYTPLSTQSSHTHTSLKLLSLSPLSNFSLNLLAQTPLSKVRSRVSNAKTTNNGTSPTHEERSTPRSVSLLYDP